ncbi:class I SAM-dependent methyltransferase [Persicobacter psychrovividus]|uniref:Methyltransferase type 11 domain-containing protein n=1 Tax=Persicobacter psychrovividus TaxID=387638 RepID=A0ABM7VI76_9BACT|nr:hypothetical protein PEPS_29540 [Persicobacter psychrovividus]
MFSLIADNTNPNSLAAKSRAKRIEFFKQKVKALGRPVKILDVGGTQHFWEAMGFDLTEGSEIYLLNLRHQPVSSRQFFSLKGNAVDLSSFGDNHFDIVFSNSVIEHLFSWENQCKMASEIQRVGQYYFIQTPNYWFPIEPHFVFPLFQYLPKELQIKMTENFNLGHIRKAKSRASAEAIVNEIKLLTINQMENLFPDCAIYLDKIFGLNKSIIAHNFDQPKLETDD